MNKFLTSSSEGNATNGSLAIVGKSIGANNLTPGYPLKVNGLRQLSATLLSIADVNGLQTALDQENVWDRETEENALIPHTSGDIIKINGIETEDGTGSVVIGNDVDTDGNTLKTDTIEESTTGAGVTIGSTFKFLGDKIIDTNDSSTFIESTNGAMTLHYGVGDSITIGTQSRALVTFTDSAISFDGYDTAADSPYIIFNKDNEGNSILELIRDSTSKRAGLLYSNDSDRKWFSGICAEATSKFCLVDGGVGGVSRFSIDKDTGSVNVTGDNNGDASLNISRTAFEDTNTLKFTTGATTRWSLHMEASDNSLYLSNSSGTKCITVNNSSDKVTLSLGTGVNEFSTDGTFASNSDDAVPTEKATVTYVASQIANTVDGLFQQSGGNVSLLASATDNLKIDSITEYTVSNGVSVDTVLMSNGRITPNLLQTDAYLEESNSGDVNIVAAASKQFRFYTGASARGVFTASTSILYGDVLFPGAYGDTIASGSTVLMKSDGQIGTVSSYRHHKMFIKNFRNVEYLLKLNPVKFKYRKRKIKRIDPSGRKHFTYTDEPEEYWNYGLIRDEVSKIDPVLISEGGVNYHFLSPMLIAGYQKHNEDIISLKTEIDELRIENKMLKKSSNHNAVKALVREMNILRCEIDRLKKAVFNK